MYAWLHHLRWPHPRPGGVLALIIFAVAAALWFYAFPWAALHLPIDSSGFTAEVYIPVPLVMRPLGVYGGREPAPSGRRRIRDAPFCTKMVTVEPFVAVPFGRVLAEDRAVGARAPDPTRSAR